MAAFSKGFLSEDDFEAVLATLCYYDYSANAFEADGNIADQKHYHKCSLSIIVCCIAKAYHQ